MSLSIQSNIYSKALQSNKIIEIYEESVMEEQMIGT